MTEATAPVADGQGSAPASSSAALATPAPAAAPAAPTSTVVAPPPAAPGPTAAIPWLDGADETTLGYVANKGWQKPAELLNSYQNLEKLLGADKANNAIIIPKGDADPKEWQAVYDRLGRPTGPDGYKVQIPDGIPPELATETFAKYHELGLTKAQGEALASFEVERAVAAQNKVEADKTAARAAENATLRAEWGQAYEQNRFAAGTAARGLGLDDATIDKISDGIGHKATMQLLHKIGSKMSEPGFVAGDNTERFNAVLTPGQAKDTIRQRMADKVWVDKYRNGGMESAEFKEMQRLQAWANPG